MNVTFKDKAVIFMNETTILWKLQQLQTFLFNEMINNAGNLRWGMAVLNTNSGNNSSIYGQSRRRMWTIWLE